MDRTKVKASLARTAALGALLLLLLASNPQTVMGGPEDQQASVPAAPVVHAVHVISEDSVFVEWQSDDEDDSITGYRILRGTDPGSLAVIEEDTGLDLTGPGWGIYEDIAPPPGRTVWYAVQARNAAGLSPQSNAFEVDIPGEAIPDPDPPAAPTGLAGAAQHDRVTLTWDDPGDDSITGYQVLRGLRVEGEETAFQVLVDDTASPAASYVDTGVEPETAYAYRIRARSTNGLGPESADFNADTPAPPVPAAPDLLGTALLSEGQVSLIWSQDPADDSITGYRILRGDSEDSLAEIEADTGSTATTYTDTDPPAGQTVWYAIQARNANGLSEPSNTLPVDTPAPETEEEPLVSARQESGDTVLLSTIELAEDGLFGAASSTQNQRFTTGPDAAGYRLTRVLVELQSVSGGTAAHVQIMSGDTQPTTVVHTLMLEGSIPVYPDTGEVTYRAQDGAHLEPNTTYWVRIGRTNDSGGINVVRVAAGDDLDAGSQGWVTPGNSQQCTPGFAACLTNAYRLSIRIYGEAIVPPPADDLLLSNIDRPHAGLANVGLSQPAAQAFTTGPRGAVYLITRVQLRIKGTAGTRVVAQIMSGADRPETVVHELTLDGSLPASAGIVTFNAAEGATLEPETKYWLVLTRTSGGIGDDAVQIAFTNSGGLDGGAPGWDTSGSRVNCSTGFSFCLPALSGGKLRMRIYGEVLPNLLLSTIDRPSPASSDIEDGLLGQGFTTGPRGYVYLITSVQFRMSGTNNPVIEAQIMSGNNLPETVVHELTLDGSIPSTMGVVTFEADEGASLEPETKYWVVLTRTSGDSTNAQISHTNAGGLDANAQGWNTTGNRVFCFDVLFFCSTLEGRLRMRIYGEALVHPTIEPAGDDFPLSTDTRGVVIPGLTSSGSLTDPEDRSDIREHADSGYYVYEELRGDRFRLEVSANRRYRLTARFGANPGIDTAGSIGVLQVDRTTGVSSSINANDDHYDDGVVFVEFDTSWNRDYYVDVDAAGLDNRKNDQNFTDYTLTLEDISDIEKVVVNDEDNPTGEDTALSQTETILDTDSSDRAYAAGFVPGNNSGRGWELDRVRVLLDNIGPGAWRDPGNTAKVRIDLVGPDGAEVICSVTGAEGITVRQPRRTYEDRTGYVFDFLAGGCAGTRLEPTTDYWLVFYAQDSTATSGRYRMVQTSKNGQSNNGSGWIIGDFSQVSTDYGTDSITWSLADSLVISIFARDWSWLRQLDVRPGIRGKMVVGEQLTVDTGPITDDGPNTPTLTYQWQRDGSDIPGATSETYTLVDDDAGKRMSVRVSFTYAGVVAETRSSLRSSRVITPVRKLVGNTSGTSPARTEHKRGFSQGFSTGSNAQGYFLDHVISYLGGRMVSIDDYSVRIYEAQTNYLPDTSELLTILDNPGAVQPEESIRNHYAPPGTLLECCQHKYSLALNSSGGTIYTDLIQDTTEDSDGLSDWDMDGKFYVVDSNFASIGETFDSRQMYTAVYGRERLSNAPYLTGLSVTSDPANGNSYVTGDTIEITATLSAAAPGFLILPVTIGSKTVHLTAASNGNTYVFRHTVAAGERDSDGITFDENAMRGYADADLGHRRLEADTANRVNAVLRQQSNTPATGVPGITGTASLGQTLTADTSGIADEDGMTGAVFTYQWIRHDLATATDTDIDGATAGTYTVTASDEGHGLRVRVTFTDDAGNQESLTSDTVISAPPIIIPDDDVSNTQEAVAPTISGVARVGETLTVDIPGIDDKKTDLTLAYQWLADDTDIPGAIASTYTVSDADVGKAISVTVTATDGQGNEASMTSEATDPVAPRVNTPATGAPAIGGTAQPGDTLTVDTSAIADDDGLTGAAFTYQWLADDTEIPDADASTYTVADADVGKTLRVTVTFTDDAGNEESLTSTATATVRHPLTASIHDAEDAHDGGVFTFELRFSENIPISYRTLRDHAFTVTGGEVTGARRLVRSGDSRNLRWEISVRPDGNGAVTIVLPATGDCSDDGAFCTPDGRKLSNRLELVVPGPGG